MQTNIDFISVDATNTALLKEFLSDAGDSLTTFRYFNKRKFTALKNHLCTYLIVENKIPIGYGHLDKEDGKVWLGIAIAEYAKGKGYGNRMMEKLIETAKKIKLDNIYLSVDNDNSSAIKLYEKHGFMLEKKSENISFFILNLTA